MSVKNEKKRQLGIHPSTASNRLKVKLMYDLAKRLDIHWCYQCGAEIESSKDISIEHIIPWLHSEDPKGLFFDLKNIVFSHKSCNYGAARSRKGMPCPSTTAYQKGCRCEGCKRVNSEYKKKLRSRSY